MAEYCPYCMTHLALPGHLCPNCGKNPADYHPSRHHFPSDRLLKGRYLVGRVLGEGGFGITYLGVDTTLERLVAIKEYFPNTFVYRDASVSLNVTCYAGENQAQYEKGRDQFLQEARVMARFDELPEIVQVLDFFPANNTAYIVMELLTGNTLRTLLDQQGRIPAKRLFEMLEPVLRAMNTMHGTGIIHRDISPDNMMILNNRQIKLLDFGCARDIDKEHTLTVMLKHGYAPIEQYTGYNQGPWTDVYALCATCYHCLTGQIPPKALHRMHGQDPLIPPTKLGAALTQEQEEALLRGLAVDAKNRWQSIAGLYAALYGTVIPNLPWVSDKKDIDRKTLPPEPDLKPKPEPKPEPKPKPKPIKTQSVKLIATCVAIAILLVGVFAWRNFFKPSETGEPENNKEAAQGSDETDNAENIEPPVQGTWWSFEDNVLTIHGAGPMDDYPYNYRPWDDHRSDIKKVVIEDGVTDIGEYAFYKCQELSEVSIPDNVKSIGEFAFAECSALKNITIPENITSIGVSAFTYSGLVTITIPSGIRVIRDYTFSGCKGLTSVTIPDSVVSIGKEAFAGCDNLTKVFIPNHETIIDSTAFGRNTDLEGVPLPVRYDDSEVYEYKPELTPEQEVLINNLHADDLPKDAVALDSVQLDQIWRDTLIPLASDAYYDVTLYGAVNAEWLAEARQQGEEVIWSPMPEPLIVLRYGENVVSHVCAWFSNVKYDINPWIAVDDFDNDGKKEIAICTYGVSGTGAAHHTLLIYDLELQQFFLPDVSNLDISVDSAWEENCITLRGGGYTVEVSVDDFVTETEDMHTITYGRIMDYTYKHYGVQLETSLSYGYDGIQYFAYVTAPIIFSDGQYKLGDVTSISMAQ